VVKTLKEKPNLSSREYVPRIFKKTFLTHLGVGWDLLDKHFFLPWMPGTKG